MRVKDAMSPREKLITAPPKISILDAMDILVINRIGSLVITDDEDTVIGFITGRDLMAATVNYEIEALNKTVEEVMSVKLLTVNENDLLKNAVVKMEEYQTHHILVKNNEGKITGILSSFDIIRESSLNTLYPNTA